MHREFDATDRPFRPRSNLGLYSLTLVVGSFLIADLWPPLSQWLQVQGLDLPTWQSRELFGFRFALIAAVIGGAKSLFSSLEKLTEGTIGADLAIAIACIAAILINEPIVAAEVIVIGLVGECLEAVTFDRTQNALRKLAELFPLRCWILRDGEEIRAYTSEIRVDDLVVVKPGGKIPADGIVTAGASEVDLSALTGESVPVAKGPGDEVLAGAVVQLGSLTIRVKKVAKETVAGQVIEVTEKTLKEKGRAERLADRLAKYFLPAVLILAAITFLFHVSIQFDSEGKRLAFGTAARLASYPALAVLVVACPCPLVLATPAAVIAALGRLAGTGVLLKGGAALERLAGVTAFAFDKTGTLTEGKLALGAIDPTEFSTPDELLSVAASAEQLSEHPLARVLVQAAKVRNLQLVECTQFQAHPGTGISTMLNERTVLVGTMNFLQTNGITITDSVRTSIERLDSEGQSSLLVARDGVILGVIGAIDRLRPEAAGVIAELRELGIEPITLLTGDRSTVARAVAGNLPLTEIRAELLPARKAELLPANCAFVGDGINDAPALAKASVGLAVGGGTDIAAEAGDIVLLGEPLRSIPLLVRLSRQSVRIIRQNILWFGFGVNLFGVVLTGWIWPLVAPSADWFEKSPLLAALYHQAGSFLVLLNSMRLLAFERSVSRKIGPVSNTVTSALDRFRVEELFHEASHYWKIITLSGILVAFVVWSLSGITQVNADEAGVVRRFGELQDDLAPGLHVRWPWPVEEVVKLRPSEPRTVEVGFRSLTEEKRLLIEKARLEQEKLRRPGVGDPGMTWGASHLDGIQRLTDESLMLTGDGNLVEVLATVRYTIADPREFLLHSSEPDAVIRSAAESVFRELASSRPFLELLTTNRTEFETRAFKRLKERIHHFSPNGLGIELAGLSVHDLHPPQEVVGSYHAVAEAIQRRDKAVNEAEAEATRMKRRSEEDALRGVRTAEAEAARKVADATANRDVFQAWAKSRSNLPVQEERKLSELLETRVKAGTDRTVAEREIAELRQRMIAERKFLTDFRLSLDAVTLALRGRDKILLDVDKLPGKRHILLMDADSIPRLPLAFPPRSGTDPRDP